MTARFNRRDYMLFVVWLCMLAIVFCLPGCASVDRVKDLVGRARVIWRDTAPADNDRDQGTNAPTSEVPVPGTQPTAGDVTIDRVGAPDPVPEGFAGVRWLGVDASKFKETARLSEVRVSRSSITLEYDKTRVWPPKPYKVRKVIPDGTVKIITLQLNANPWIFVKQGGQWYAATFEWMTPGQVTKERKAVKGDHIKAAPLHTFAPKSGEWYGFMVSSLARGNMRSVNERSNVVMYRWP